MTNGRRKPAAKKSGAKKTGAKKTGARKPAAKRSAGRAAASRRPARRSAAGADLRRRIEGWCAGEALVEVVGDRPHPGYDLILVLRVTGTTPEGAEVRAPKGADHLEIARSWSVGLPADREATLLSDVQSALVSAPPLTRAGLRREDDGAYLDVTSTVYLDGLSQHTFMAALDATLGASRIAAPVAVRAGGRDALESKETPAAAAGAADVGFAPTHEVPAGGARAWAEPDPAGRAIAELQPRVRLQVLEERGAWAHVVGENGWTGWVDGRRLKKRRS